MRNIAEFIMGIPNIKDRRSDALTTKVNRKIVDTCDTSDCGWETGVNQNGTWIIVEEYPSKMDAIEGHRRWVDKLRKNPKIKLKSCRTASEWFFK